MVSREIHITLPKSFTKNSQIQFLFEESKGPTPSQWYSEHIAGINVLRNLVSCLLKDANLNGYFTSHNLRWSGPTRLFLNGIDHKLAKEFTGHLLDTVNRYQLTSDEQRVKISEIIQGEVGNEKEK